MKYAGIFIPLGALGLAVFLLLSISPESLYLQDLGDQKAPMEELLHIQKDDRLTSEGLFIVNSRIQRLLESAGRPDLENLFLSTYAASHGEDPFLTYYYYQVAENYRKRKAEAFAAIYYERILKNYPDLIYRGESLHKTALERLIEVSPDPRKRLDFLNFWIQNYSDPEILPRMQYYLGQTLEALGEYEPALEAYRIFLSHPDTLIPGEPQAWKKTREYVDFYRSSKAWVRPTLESLVSSLKDAFGRSDIRSIETLRSKRGFSILTWSTMEAAKETDMENREFVADQVRSRASPIAITGEVHRDSTDREVFLKSTGWSFALSPVFYLHLKKVDFLADPEINGGWEWVGLYMGEKL